MTNFKLLPILIIAFLLLGTTKSIAQQKKPRQQPPKQKIEQLKIAFFTRELDLTTEEAEKFWPLYNEMTEKTRAKKKENKKAVKEIKDNHETLTEEEFKTKTEAVLDLKIEELELQKEYYGKIAEIIGYKKASKLLSLEAQFKRELLKRLANEEKPEESND